MPGRPEVRIEIRRVYEDVPDAGTHRVLVDRLWPRGIRKEDAPLDEWARDLAPTAELRRWYGHDPAKYPEFARRYREELAQPPAAEVAARLGSFAGEHTLVLVTATRDVEHSGARVLRDYLLARPSAPQDTGG